MSSRALDDLDARFKPKAMEFLARLTEAGVVVKIVNTRRTAAEQAENLRKGTSWVPHSKHEDGLALDVCLWADWSLHGSRKLEWDASDPAWQDVGRIAESLGLRWGGRWTPQRDMGHVELPGAP